MDKQLVARILSYFIENNNDLSKGCYSIVISSDSGIPNVSISSDNESFYLEKDFDINFVRNSDGTLFLFKFKKGNFELDKISFDVSNAKNPYSLKSYAEEIQEKMNEHIQQLEAMKYFEIEHENYSDRKAWESPYGPKMHRKRKY